MTKWTPKVSIVTPSYNAEAYLEESLESVFNQSFEEWERIIVDDGSGDRTCEIAQAAQKRDKRIRFIQHPENKGAYAARNTAFDAARGQYIAFLDADDLWHPDKLKRQLTFMQSMGYGFTYHQYRYVDEAGNPLTSGPPWMPATVDYQAYLGLTGTVGCLTVMVDREQTGPFHMKNTRSEDFVLWLDLLKRVRGYGLFEDLAKYRVVRGSLSSNKLQVISWIWDVLRHQEAQSLTRSTHYLGAYLYRGVMKNAPWERLLKRNLK